MFLTPEQLREIQKIIEEHHQALAVNTIGPDAVPPEVLEELKKKGLLSKDSINSIGDSYTFGHLLGMLEQKGIAHMSYRHFKEYIEQNPVPFNDVQRGAMRMAALNAGQYCRGLGNRVDVATGATLIEADRILRARMESDISTATEANVARGEIFEKLRSDLGWATRDWARDLKRIAVTEKVTAMNQGTADQFREDYGADVHVFKRALPGACRHCQRLYTGPDGNPIVYRLSDLEANGTNVGRKSSEWLPVVGATHPNCTCILARRPKGWGWNEDGDLVPGGEVTIAGEETDIDRSLDDNNLQKAWKLQGRMEFQGIPIAIENKEGSVRKWRGADGSTGETKMVGVSYGYVEGTLGADEDEIDVFIGPRKDAENVYVVHQQDPSTWMYDEVKTFLGFKSAKEAQNAYFRHYDTRDFFGWIETMSVDSFKRLIVHTKRKEKPSEISVQFSKSSPDGLRGDVVFGGKFLDSCAFFVKGKGFVSWPEASASTISCLSSSGKAPSRKSLPYGGLMRSKSSSNFSNAMASIPEGDGFIQVPGPRPPMSSPVLGCGHNLKVGGVIIKSIPVAVMDIFLGAKWATENKLHNHPMLKSLSSVFPDKPIACVGFREFANMAALKSSTHEPEHSHENNKRQTNMSVQNADYRFVIPLDESFEKAAPKGGKYKDPRHKIPWQEPKKETGRKELGKRGEKTSDVAPLPGQVNIYDYVYHDAKTGGELEEEKRRRKKKKKKPTQQELMLSLSPHIGAATSPAGNRAPGPGLGVNYVIFPPSKPAGTGVQPGAEELIKEAAKEGERGVLHTTKEEYEFTEQQRNVHPYEVPERIAEGHEEAREGSEDRKKMAEKRATDNVLRPLNRAPVRKQD